MSVPADGEEILRERKQTGWLANGCHPLSAMMAVGGPVSSVAVHRAQNDGGICVLEFKKGILGNFHLAAGPGHTQPLERYTFFGNKCHAMIENSLKVTFQRGIECDYAEGVTYVPEGLDSGAVVWEPQNGWSMLENKAAFTQGIWGEMQYFCDRILAGEPAEKGSLEFALNLMQVYEAALLSNGNRIWLDES